ncbi:MAG: pilus assembly protein TadG-related protein [Pirellulaceae bacterium]
MLILVAFLMIFLLIFSAMIINLAYMQLVDTEMRAATDAAARAGRVWLEANR